MLQCLTVHCVFVPASSHAREEVDYGGDYIGEWSSGSGGESEEGEEDENAKSSPPRKVNVTFSWFLWIVTPCSSLHLASTSFLPLLPCPPPPPFPSPPLLSPYQEGAQELFYCKARVRGVLVSPRESAPKPPAGGKRGETATSKTHHCCKQ